MHHPKHNAMLRRGGLTVALLAIAGVAGASVRPSVAVTVSGLTGEDQDVAQSVSRAFVADLGRSDKIAVSDATGAAPAARFQVIASCHALDSHLLINVRVMDCAAGRSLPGAADSVLVDRGQIDPAVAELAVRLAGRIGEAANAPAPAPAARPAGLAHRTPRHPVAVAVVSLATRLARTVQVVASR